MILLIIESNEKPIVKNLSQIVDNNTNYNVNELIEDNIINENNTKLKGIKIKKINFKKMHYYPKLIK